MNDSTNPLEMLADRLETDRRELETAKSRAEDPWALLDGVAGELHRVEMTLRTLAVQVHAGVPPTHRAPRRWFNWRREEAVASAEPPWVSAQVAVPDVPRVEAGETTRRLRPATLFVDRAPGEPGGETRAWLARGGPMPRNRGLWSSR
ncbi:hypothetical protein [Paractinoplanes toevensis]|uniref:Uncharacterized protein n=1 Tax=Paractinoplanes toevensis TaxID=571911 RepID=A0A919W4P6_9ACTN|nr:hypothetical protein [Actinoplanes toevensis]GIM90348.1 hypothetical protein Ato02nite_021410 [Actinoplanes toevensis]